LEQLYHHLVDFLVQSDFILADTLAFLMQRHDVDKHAKIWRKFFTAKGGSAICSFIDIIIAHEVRETTREGTLFRGNTFGVALMSAHARFITTNYLKSLLLPLIMWLRQTPMKNYEIDPARLQKSGQLDNLERNKANLIIALNKFLETIYASVHDVPRDIKKISATLRKEIEIKFPKSVSTAIGGFFYLRLVCPTIISPETFGILEEPITNQDERRALVLISKAIQNLSNNVTFNEDFMQDMNIWISENKEKMGQFLQHLAEGAHQPSTYEEDHDCTLTEEDYHELEDLIERNFNVLITQLESNPQVDKLSYPLVGNLTALIQQIVEAELKAGLRKKRK